MYRLDIFCQPEQIETILSVLHKEGVDKIGNYDHCWAISAVKGSHRALDGARPVFGEIGKVENYQLLKIEINVRHAQVKQTVMHLKKALGWDEPMVNIFKLENLEFEI